MADEEKKAEIEGEKGTHTPEHELEELEAELKKRAGELEEILK